MDKVIPINEHFQHFVEELGGWPSFDLACRQQNKGCPILRMFLRRVGTTDLDVSVPLYRSSHHLRNERKDGAPSSKMAHTKDQSKGGPPANTHSDGGSS
jgi:hypothetical protein